MVESTLFVSRRLMSLTSIGVYVVSYPSFSVFMQRTYRIPLQRSRIAIFMNITGELRSVELVQPIFRANPDKSVLVLTNGRNKMRRKFFGVHHRNGLRPDVFHEAAKQRDCD